jgi:signal transduction histidine kinase
MRRRISWLVAATTSAIILAFVIPLGLLVRSMAQDRALAGADLEARNVAILVSSLHDSDRLAGLVGAVDRRFPSQTTVLLADGRVLGDPDDRVATDPMVVRAKAGSAFTVVDGDGGHVLVPVVTEAGTDVVRTTVTPEVLHEGVARSWMTIGGLGILLLLVAVITASRLGRRISTPVTQVAAVADRIRDGDFAARAEPVGPAETVALAEALNRLSERIVELLAAERAAVGDVSHRLRTPVTALRLDVEAVADPEISERLRLHVGRLQRSIDAIVKDARRPVRTDATASSEVVETVRAGVDFWAPLAEDQGRALHVRLPEGPVRVQAHESDIRDLLDVLVDNVFAHTDAGVPFSVDLAVHEDRVDLCVSDEGGGFDPDAEHVAREGSTGLGLEMARRTARAFGGNLSVQTGLGGTRVTVAVRRES